MVQGGVAAGPLAFYLLADGVALTPSSAVDPVGTAWQQISRTFDATALAGHAGESITIVIGVQDENDLGGRMVWDNITLDGDNLWNPYPKDGSTIERNASLEMSWTNRPPVDANDVYVDVWWGTEPNLLHPEADWNLIVDAEKNATSVIVDASAEDTYYWKVNTYVNGSDKIDDANMIEGELWLYHTTDDLAPTVEINTPDKMTWSGEGVPLDSTVTDDTVSALTIEWSADDDSLANPNLTIEILNGDTADATVTITKAEPTGGPITVTMTVTVGDVTNPAADTASMTIVAYDDACQMAQFGQGRIAITDFNNNCITGLEDLAVMVEAWLDDYSSTGQADRP
jgi:hypothetical protein